MASYLKFDGVRDGLVAPGFPGIPATSLVVTTFVRVHALPDQVMPIAQIYDSATTTIGGIWLIPPAALATTRGRIFGVNVRNTVTEQRISNIAVDVSGNPFRRGLVYKLQLMVDNTTGAVSFGVDGVRVATLVLSSPLGGVASFYALAGEFSQFNGTTPLRAGHVDILQAMFEIDRTLATSGGFPTIDADSDPFTNLSLAPSANSDSALYNLNAGTGATVTDDSGNGHTLATSGASTFPDWAPTEADPKRPGPGVARWLFDTIEGYPCRQATAPTVMPQPTLHGGPDRLGLAKKAPIWWEDGERTAQFPVATNLTADLAQPFASRRSLKADGAVAVTNSSDIPTPGGLATKRFTVLARFFDPGGVSATRVQRVGTCTTLNALRVMLGFQGAVSVTNYVAFISGGGGGDFLTIDPVAAGWHECAIFGQDPGGGAAGILRLYFDGALKRTELGLVITGFFGRVAIRQIGVAASNDHAFYDELEVGLDDTALDTEYGFLVEASGTRILPPLQPPEGVRFFRSVTISETTAGTDTESVGATSYTFRHSTDGGGTFSAPAALNTANLRALACAGNGQDVLEVTVAQTAGMDNMSSPKTSAIEVDFESATALLFPDEEFRRDEEMLLEEVA